jgi:serine/threonine-protein phosphatase 4 regulatory subunit 1
MTDVLSSFGFEGEEEEEGSHTGEEGLEIDDSLSALEKINKYMHSDLILHRLYLVRELAEYAKELGFAEATEKLLPILREIQRDVEPVIRQALVEQIPLIAAYLIQEGGERATEAIVSTLLPIIAQFSRDINSQVRLSSTESLVSVAGGLAKLGQGSVLLSQHVFPIITTLAKDTSQEEYRVEAAQLVHHLAETMGPELCVEFALPLLLKLSQDTFRVRKAVASLIGNMAHNVPAEVTSQQLLPLFEKMVEDEIWGVRKACAESLVSLAEAVTPTERTTRLIPLFEKLADDTSRWVRNAAFQNLGHFIATFQSNQVNSKLLGYYTGMLSSPNAVNKYADSEIITFCAFDFPAVLYTIGKERWGEVRETYFALVKDLQWKVRRPLSHSLHEVARILGTDLTEQNLLTVFELFMKDLDEVKVGVVRHIAKFLAILSPPSREKYLPVVCDITNETSNWRFRKLIARQLGELSGLYDAKTVNKWLVPISLQVCQDAVAGVRRAAFRSVGALINRLGSGDGGNAAMRDEYLEQLVAFASTFPETSYLDRQMYVNICGYVVDDISPELFAETFLPRLIMLTTDRVPNVRVVVSQVLHKLSKLPRFKDQKEVTEALVTLSKDKDRDVLYNAHMALGLPLPTGPWLRSQQQQQQQTTTENQTPSNNNNNNNNEKDKDEETSKSEDAEKKMMEQVNTQTQTQQTQQEQQQQQTG